MRDKNWIRQRLGAILAIAVLALSVFDLPVSWGQPGLGAMNVFASSEQDSLWATASNAVYKKGASQDVDIYVIAEDNDVCPGNLSEMTLYLKNNTNCRITQGSLTFDSSYIRKRDGMFDGDWLTATPSDATASEMEEDSSMITGIVLDPGEWQEIRFEFYTDEGLGPAKASVSFRFEGETEEGPIRSVRRFRYGIGLPTVNLELEDMGWQTDGSGHQLNIWMSEPDWQDWTDRKDEEEPAVPATVSQSDAFATVSQWTGGELEVGTGTATSSDLDDSGEKKDLETIQELQSKAMKLSEARVRYEVEIFGAELEYFRPRRTEDDTELGWISCICRLEPETKPGVYYGKVKATGTWNRRSFTTEQGFLFEVTGGGLITLVGKADGAEIRVAGPVSSFPEAEELKLQAETLSERELELLDSGEMVPEQLYGAIRLRLLADGAESQLLGPVTVSIAHKQIEETAGVFLHEDGTDALIENETVAEREAETAVTEGEETEIPEQIQNQGPGAVMAYLAGEPVWIPQRISRDGHLIGSEMGKSYSETLETEEVVFPAGQAGLSLLAASPEGGQLRPLTSGITRSGRLQTEVEYLPETCVIANAAYGNRMLTYDGQDISVCVAVPDGWKIPENAGLSVDKIASGSETETGERYDRLFAGAQEELAHGLFSVKFYDIQIVDVGTGQVERAVWEGSGAAPAPMTVELCLKNGLPDVSPGGRLEVLSYAEGERLPAVLEAETGGTGNGGTALTATFSAVALGTYGIAWADTVEIVETGGPGTGPVTGAGLVLMLGAFWLLEKDRQAERARKEHPEK